MSTPLPRLHSDQSCHAGAPGGNFQGEASGPVGGGSWTAWAPGKAASWEGNWLKRAWMRSWALTRAVGGRTLGSWSWADSGVSWPLQGSRAFPQEPVLCDGDGASVTEGHGLEGEASEYPGRPHTSMGAGPCEASPRGSSP